MPRPSGSSIDRKASLVLGLIVASSIGLAWILALAASGIRGNWDDRLDDLFFQLRYRIRGPEKTLPSIVHVDLSDSEVQALGMRGGDRRAFAELTRIASEAGASSIIFDVIFPENGEPQGDKAFVAAVAEAGKVFLPAIMSPREYDKYDMADGREPDQLSRWLWHPKILRAGDPPMASRATLSFPELSAAARGIAHFNSQSDPDGVYRRMPLLIGYSDGYLPSLALRAACEALRVDPSSIEVSFGESIRLPAATMPDGERRDLSIPVDRGGRMIVDFAAPWDAAPSSAAFTRLSFAGLLEAAKTKDGRDQIAAVMDGSLVLVADITTSSSDYGAIPFERVYPKAGLHLNVLNGILSGDFLRAPPWWLSLLLNVAFAFSIWLASSRARPLASCLISLVSWALLAALESWLFMAGGVMPALAAPTLGLALALIVASVYRIILEEREKLAFRLRMERYFAPQLLAKIASNRDRIMSAEKKVVTILFSDIAGFTSWSTTQSPEAIHRALNEYFEAMTEIVFRNEGTVDKFIGDGLMAFFGDPLPQADHALRAVRTGIEMQQALRKLREGWQEEGRKPFHIRIGINTGEVVVGDMGSSAIMAYTAIGAEVNLASRLESGAPHDGILISASVYAAVKDSIDTSFAGRITAKGITKEFDTWEVKIP